MKVAYDALVLFRFGTSFDLLVRSTDFPVLPKPSSPFGVVPEVESTSSEKISQMWCQAQPPLTPRPACRQPRPRVSLRLSSSTPFSRTGRGSAGAPAQREPPGKQGKGTTVCQKKSCWQLAYPVSTA